MSEKRPNSCDSQLGELACFLWVRQWTPDRKNTENVFHNLSDLFLCHKCLCSRGSHENLVFHIYWYNQTYMHWNIYTTVAQNLHLHVSRLLGCHHQEVFIEVKLVLTEK